MKKAMMFLFMAGMCHGMELETARNRTTDSFSLENITPAEERRPSVLAQSSDERVQRLGSPMYYPRYYDATGFLEKEFGCCFCLGRCILQPLSVVAPLASSLLVRFGEWYISSSPKTSALLNGLGLGASIIGFVTNVLMIKINNKLEHIDNHLGERNQQPSEAEA